MDADSLQAALAGLPLGGIVFTPRTGSTNDDAARWAESGAPDLSLVVADEQTGGRGRFQRRWFTPPEAALALSLVLKPGGETAQAARYTALGALAVCDALSDCCRLAAQIKWPNDVLIDRRKVAGILVEAHWQNEALIAIILGIGVNVRPASVPPAEDLIFPATSVEEAARAAVDREELLRLILSHLIGWRQRIASPAFLEAWEARLAFRGEQVQVLHAGQEPPAEGLLLGIDEGGRLRLQNAAGSLVVVSSGDVRLRPVDY